ncbi:hypothetical protein BU26DRAFT_569998 [Trematosphaeria pertusa]|uniref:Uncharacterized protein n=1 Tax=Trematosphaeria pertusa TaxID=390896 RepID=A0A6A6HZ36_9PLEO|nr:uncharacterized protein BU26DRAFT_569998 [Trematosphaeria pertusa]KAF2243297.1 hypothetical protein BU26DRAFT_569998 [Trematosphaeria pertusa]
MHAKLTLAAVAAIVTLATAAAIPVPNDAPAFTQNQVRRTTPDSRNAQPVIPHERELEAAHDGATAYHLNKRQDDVVVTQNVTETDTVIYTVQEVSDQKKKRKYGGARLAKRQDDDVVVTQNVTETDTVIYTVQEVSDQPAQKKRRRYEGARLGKRQDDVVVTQNVTETDTVIYTVQETGDQKRDLEKARFDNDQPADNDARDV